MTIKHLILAAAFCAALAAPARACLAGWDCKKWDNPNHNTPKYVVGRIIANFPSTPAGLRSALPVISAIYPGTVILPGKGDKVRIPCVGVIDLIVAAGEGGKSWWWGADEALNECNKCTPNRCEAGGGVGPGAGGPGSGFGGAAGNCAGVQVPNRLSVVQQTARDNPDAWKAKLNPKEMEECRPDSRYIDLVVDNLRKEDIRWGFNCKRGNCNDPSHDVIAYYFGQGKPYEGAPQVMLVDMIQNTCAPNAQPAWLVLDFGEGAGWTSKGRFASGPKQNVTVHCPKNEPKKPHTDDSHKPVHTIDYCAPTGTKPICRKEGEKALWNGHKCRYGCGKPLVSVCKPTEPKPACETGATLRWNGRACHYVCVRGFPVRHELD